MRTRLVYDLPTRVFHWLFAGLFLAAFTIANILDDESALFPYHMLAGLTLVFAVALRVVWGFAGTRHARFASFPMRPVHDLLAYFKAMAGRGPQRIWAGHNPASSWAAIIMMTLAVGLAFTGYRMVSGADKGTYKELHELFANAFLAVALLHIAGMILHLLRHRDGFPLSMLDGRKSQATDAETINDTKPHVALLLVALIGVFAGSLWRGYDPASQSLNLLGATFHLGEAGNAGYGAESRKTAMSESDED